MKRLQTRLGLTSAATGAALLLSGCQTLDLNQEVDGFPDFTAWTTYGTSTSTYADVAAVANALADSEEAQIRILTSDTAVGRLAPLRNEQSVMSRTGDEYSYAFHGDQDFAHPDWGPQDLRMVWAPTAPHSFMVREGRGIEAPMDLEGMRVPVITANPSVQNKFDAMLAYAGLTWDDVTPVPVGYSEQAGALQDGQIDVIYLQVYGSALYELESATPVSWLDFDPEDEERTAALQEVSPGVEIGEFANAPGQPDGEPDDGFVYPLPMVSYAHLADSHAYAMAEALTDSFDTYSGATATTSGWGTDEVVTTPVLVPFHDGTIELLDELGLWTEEAQARNDELIDYGEKLREEWPVFMEQADSQGDLKEQWTAWKDTHVEPLSAPTDTND